MVEKKEKKKALKESPKKEKAVKEGRKEKGRKEVEGKVVKEEGKKTEKKAVKEERKGKAGKAKEGKKEKKAAGKTKEGKRAFDWIEYKPKELEEIVVNLANAGNSKSEIGAILRDQYGVPDIKRFTKKTLSKILEENNLLEEIPEDLLNLIKKSASIEKHLERNKKDFTAKRGYQLTVSKINRLVKYYRKKGKLPEEWRFSAETAKLLVK